LPPTLAHAVVALASFPSLVKESLLELYRWKISEPTRLLIERPPERSHRVRLFPAPEDSGYLLFSGVRPTERQAIIQLIRVSDGEVLAKWIPDWRIIGARVTDKKFMQLGSLLSIQAIHPFLLTNGDVIFNVGAALIRQSPCVGAPVWVLDEYAHHSIERAGKSEIWVASYSMEGFADNEWLRMRVKDDAIAKVSEDGKLLERRSFVKILRENGLGALVLGTAGLRLQDDPIHINQIKQAQRTTQYWNEGDLLISSRHLSTVFLYRPATNTIVWYKTGPWMNQHSVDFLGDRQLYVFDNHVFGGAPASQPFVTEGGINRVLVFSFETGAVTEPYEKLLADARPATMTGGRAQILPDGGLFIEETESGRLLRFKEGRMMWSLINDYDDERVGLGGWSRYLTAEEAEEPLKALRTRGCPATR